MKKTLFLCLLAIGLCGFMPAHAQNYALIDMEYILKAIPDYEKANKQLEAQSGQWQAAVEKLQQEAQAMYKAYQTDKGKLSAAEQSQRETAILNKEKETQDLRNKYFGADGELNKLRQQLIKPIQDAIYEAVKVVATENSIDVVVDRASAMSIIFANPDIDISNDVLIKMGYLKLENSK